MRTSIAIVALVVGLAGSSHASPYFRSIVSKDAGGGLMIAHPQPIFGALFDPRDLGNTEGTSLFPLVTHSPRDGCLFPSLICEDWSPLAVGFSMNAGKITFVVAPIANVLPWVQNAAMAVIPDKFAKVRDFLAPNPGSAVTFSAGPAWEYKQATNKGYFKPFTGLTLHF